MTHSGCLKPRMGPLQGYDTHRLPRLAARKYRFLWQAQGICMRGGRRQSQTNLGFWMFTQPSQYFGYVLFGRLTHPHPRAEAAGRRAWVRLCRK